MKLKDSMLRKSATVFAALFASLSMAFADGVIEEVYLTGNSNSAAGNYVVQTTGDLFQFQGKLFEVYKVFYDDPEMNMKIAVNKDGACASFVAYNDDFMFFYDCTRYGFGVRKVMFSNPWMHEKFDSNSYHDQSVLVKQRKVDRKDAIGLIASYVPQLHA